jgi:hypothetical protein
MYCQPTMHDACMITMIACMMANQSYMPLPTTINA